jgi:hypothetical protein
VRVRKEVRKKEVRVREKQTNKETKPRLVRQ